METAISTLRLLPETKDQQIKFAKQIIAHVAGGMGDVLETELFLKSFENVIKEVRQDSLYKEILFDECDKYPEKSFKMNGATVTKGLRSAWNFSEDSKHSVLKKQLKDRETLLKSITDTNKVVDQDTGECLIQPSKKQSDYLIIKFE